MLMRAVLVALLCAKPAMSDNWSLREGDLAAFEASVYERAMEYSASGNLPDALSQWSILRALQPDNPVYESGLRNTKLEIELSVVQLMNSAKSRTSKQRLLAVDDLMLALSMSPGNVDVIELLYDIEKRRVANALPRPKPKPRVK